MNRYLDDRDTITQKRLQGEQQKKSATNKRTPHTMSSLRPHAGSTSAERERDASLAAVVAAPSLRSPANPEAVPVASGAVVVGVGHWQRSAAFQRWRRRWRCHAAGFGACWRRVAGSVRLAVVDRCDGIAVAVRHHDGWSGSRGVVRLHATNKEKWVKHTILARKHD